MVCRFNNPKQRILRFPSATLLTLVAVICALAFCPVQPTAASTFAAMTSLDEGGGDLPMRLGPVEQRFDSVDEPFPANENFLPANACKVCRLSDGEPYHWQILPQGLIYKQYLAGVKESRFRGVWNHDASGRDLWDASLGGQVGLVRYGSYYQGRPVGWQLDLEGAGQVRLDRDQDMDVDAADYRVGVPLTWGDNVSQWKFAFYHLSSHLADEFLLKHPGYPRLNYSRNVLVLGYSIYPAERWRLYAEVGYAVDSDVSEEWETQFGVDYAPAGATGMHGEPFAAVNAHLREEVDFGGNVVFQLGWAWRRSPASGMFRTGVEYFNGKSDQFSFYDESEQKVGFGIWYDY